MKLQAASRREVSRIAVGVLACDVIMVAGLFLLSQFEIGTFNLVKILIGALPGSVIAVINFIILCLTVQSSLEIENKKKMKKRFQTSYNIRTVIQAVWIVAAFLLRSKIHFVAAAAPVFFPHVVILYLQFTGKLLPPSSGSAAPSAEAEDSEEESAGEA